MNISELSIKRRTGVLVISVLTAILGFFFLSSLSVDLLPRITYPLIRIMIDWKGASAEDVEKNVIEKIESSVGTTEDAVKILSTAIEGNATIEVYFEYGKDMDVALADTKAKLDLVRKELPPDIEEPRIFKADPSALPVLEIAMTSSKRDEKEMRYWVENELSKMFLGIPGLGAVVAYGGKVREIQVIFDQSKLAVFELSQENILNAIKNENIDLPAGKIDDKRNEYTVRLISKFRNIEDVENTIVANRFGRFIRVKDVAKVMDTSEDQRVITSFNGEKCVVLSFLKQPNANTVKIVNKVQKRLNELKKNKSIPKDIKFDKVSSQADYIVTAMQNVAISAIIGGLLAMTIIFLFLHNFRRTMIIAAAIPLSIFGTFIIMNFFNVTLNIFSLGGLVLAVGMILDSSIVMLENIARHHIKKGDSLKAGMDASKEIIAPLIASTLTNLAAITPFFFIEGVAALLFRDTVITISSAFIISLIVSISVVPTLSVYLFSFEDKKGIKIQDSGTTMKNTTDIYTYSIKKAANKNNFFVGIATEFGVITEKLTEFYKKAIHSVIDIKHLVLLGVAGLFIIALFIGTKLGSEFLPKIDDGKATVKIIMPEGTSISKTIDVTAQAEKIVNAMPGVKNTYIMTGGYWKRRNIYERANESSIFIELEDKGKRPLSTPKFIKKLQEKFKEKKIPGAKIKVMRTLIRGIKTTSDFDVDIRIKGPNLEKLKEISEKIFKIVKETKGIVNPDIAPDFEKPEIHIKIKREKVNDLGLNATKLSNFLKGAVDGIVAGQYTDVVVNTDYDIRVLVDPEKMMTLKDLNTIKIHTGSGASVNLADIAEIIHSKGPVSIDREDQVRVASITADVLGLNVGKVTAQIREKLKDFELPAGYSITYSGEAQSAAESNKRLLIVIILAIILVYSVMSVQYDSLLDPLIIMFTVPLSVIGAFFTLFITGTPFGTTVFLGLILLVGIVINNAIVLVEFIKNFRKNEGLSVKDAVVKAGSVRLRPIMMTTLAAIMGMLPIAMGWGEGLEMLKPLSLTVLGGLLVGSFFTLFVIPIIYIYMYKNFLKEE